MTSQTNHRIGTAVAVRITEYGVRVLRRMKERVQGTEYKVQIAGMLNVDVDCCPRGIPSLSKQA